MIERRELLMAGAGLAAAGTLAVPAAAQRHRMEGMAMSMTDCIDDCVASHRMCLETAAWLTKQGGASATASLIAMLNDCAELCQATANSMLRESALHRIVCRACEEVCPVDAVLITDPGDVEAAMAGADTAPAPAIAEAAATEGEAPAEAAAAVAAEPAVAAPVWEPKPDVWLQRMKDSLAGLELPDTGMAKAKPLFREIRKETLDSLSRGKEFIALVHNDKCIGCTQCVYFCNFASIDMIEWELETRTDAFESKKALIVEDTCTGCTLCVFACPVEAITMEARA